MWAWWTLAAVRAAEPTLPILVETVPAAYPPSELAGGASAQVLLRLVVDETGAVVSAEVAESGGAAFDLAAVQAARSYRFTPATDGAGTAVPAEILYRLVFEPTQAPALSVTGDLREAGTRAPLAGADVVFERGERRLVAVTDADGTFRLAGLEPGPWTARTSIAGYREETVEVVVADGSVAEVRFYPVADRAWEVEGATDEITVYGRRIAPEVTERRLTAEEARYFPGTSGDVVKVVQNLPGVARAPLGVGQLVVRGMAPEDSGYALDGGAIPSVFHFSGLSTVLSGELVDEIVFLPGNYGVRYGRTLGGVVDLRLTPNLPERSRGFVSVDLLQTSAFVQQRFDRSALTVSARRSYIDAVLSPVLSSGATTVRAPRYADVQVRLQGEVGRGMLDALLLASDDDFRVVGEDADGEPSVAIGLGDAFDRLRLQHRAPVGETDWRHEATLLVGKDLRTFEFDGSGGAYEQSFGATFREELLRRAPSSSDGWGARLGLDVLGGSFRYEYAIPGFGEPEGADVGRLLPGLYAESTLRRGRFELIPGLRVDGGLIGPWRAVAVDPRLAGRVELGPTTVATASAGGYSQPPTVPQVIDQPDLDFQRSWQFSVGVEQRAGDAWTFGLTAWQSELRQIVAGREDAFRFFTGPPPTGPLDTGPYASVGAGRTRGLEGAVRLADRRTAGLLSVTLGNSERTDRPGGETELFVYDQPVVVTMLGSHQLPRRWRVGARVRYTSGTPYTKVVNRYFDLASRTFLPVYDDEQTRLPFFASLDVRFDKDWVFRKWTFTAYLDLQNATNRQNVEVMGWTDDFAEEAPINGLPIIPAFGFKGAW